MAQEFRYPLTRVCLRSGSLTLPRAMVGLFPEGKELVALDTKRDSEFNLQLVGARTVSGFAGYFATHKLEVNDELIVKALEDGRFSVTPLIRPRRPDYTSPDAIAAVLDGIYEAAVPVTEAEIRALYPDIPDDVELAGALSGDARFTFRDGRWHNRLAALAREAAELPARQQRTVAFKSAQTEAAAAEASEAAGAEAASELVAAAHEQPAAREAANAPGGQSALWAGAASTPATTPPPGQFTAAQAPLHPAVIERRTPPSGRPSAAGAAPSTSEASSEPDVDAPSIEASELASRLRAALTPLGFRIEPLGKGQVNIHAEMGRRGYRVLAQLLSSTERLDWADLLHRRRTSNVRYLAVIGEHRDLLRLTSPANLAHATLWSWSGLERLKTLNRTVALSPVDLESHFEQDGLFEHGLHRLETSVAERVSERGAFSELLLRLAQLRAPAVFLLEELASEARISREQVLRILERLSEAPFHLVVKVDQGEFAIRQPVGDALKNFSSYASSLRERLPQRRPERLTGLSEPDLLTDADAADTASESGEPDRGGA